MINKGDYNYNKRYLMKRYKELKNQIKRCNLRTKEKGDEYITSLKFNAEVIKLDLIYDFKVKENELDDLE